MKITIENTTKIVWIKTLTGEVQARVWEGVTDSGIPVQCLVTRIAADRDEDLHQFEAELDQTRPPTAAVQAYPLRLLL